MKNKIYFTIALIFIFSCEENITIRPSIIHLPYNSNANWYKEFFLKNISELNFKGTTLKSVGC